MTPGATAARRDARRRGPLSRLRRGELSVQVRLTVATALLVGAALAAAGLLVQSIETARIEAQVEAQVGQELAELRELRSGNDPASGEPFSTASQFLETFLSRNVPDRTEVFAAWWDGRTQRVSLGGQEVVDDPAFDVAVARLLPDSGTTVIDSAQGRLRLDVQRVEVGGSLDGPDGSPADVGALVIGTYLDRAEAGLAETMRTYALVALVLLVLATALASWLSGRLLAPLRTLRATADSISESDLSARIPERGNDDLTALTRTVNGMLGRLETAFTTQRRFLDDAGHELRTPLTVLSGHLELLDPDDREEVVATRELLLDETERMTRLVGDLMLLARSERPDFLRPSPVAPASLVRGTLAKARALGPRDWVAVVGDDERAVALDGQRISQALLQLCDNAVKHTAPGEQIEVGVARTDGRVLFWVADSGRGVPEADRGRIFERFGRSAVGRGDEGFGLGLSIVAAIARAHGGAVRVEGVDPHGARFVLELPLVLAAPPGRDPEPRVPATVPTGAAPRVPTPAPVARPTDEEPPWPAS